MRGRNRSVPCTSLFDHWLLYRHCAKLQSQLQSRLAVPMRGKNTLQAPLRQFLLRFRRSSTQHSTRPHHTLTLRRRNYIHHRSLAWSPSFRRETRPSHYRNDPVKYDLVLCYPSTFLHATKSESRLENGDCANADPH